MSDPMIYNTTQKLIRNHLVGGTLETGTPIAISIDQTLTQDATGTLVMLEFEATGLPRVKTELSVQYVDHNLIQEDFRNPDDHLFLESAARKFGIHFSGPGNGVSHPVHMERFGIPGKTLLGSDSHTPAAGALGMLAIGAGGMEIAMAMAGEPYYLTMPEILGVRLVGELRDWVSAKDVILEMLRRHGVDGGVGKIIEYFGSGLDQLSAMDRHVIANMGAELGATTSVFPADNTVKQFLKLQGRESDFQPIEADQGCEYDAIEEIDLGKLEPLIARPSSPGNVVTVKEVEGEPIYQSYIGSSANPGFRDLAVAAEIVRGKEIAAGVSFDINPASRHILAKLTESGFLGVLIRSGARIHQAGCNGCIGMGQAPATGKNSLRTVPRNFPGRSGTPEDCVWLCSPETAAASALTGRITDPRSTVTAWPHIEEPEPEFSATHLIMPPAENGEDVVIEKGPNIKSLPEFEPLENRFAAPVLLKAGDDVSTDEILPAGSRVLPFRSNIPEISRFSFERIDENYARNALDRGKKPHAIIGGRNYGQGSSREHAAVAPRYLGLCVVLAKSFARIHRANLINFGVLPLTFGNRDDYESIDKEDTLDVSINRDSRKISVFNQSKGQTLEVCHDFNDREWTILNAGGLINWIKARGAG
ncbi:MAG: aconitate hydratase [Candidatus Pelagisphaera sp.]|jgi:aconitate hydratase